MAVSHLRIPGFRTWAPTAVGGFNISAMGPYRHGIPSILRCWAAFIIIGLSTSWTSSQGPATYVFRVRLGLGARVFRQLRDSGVGVASQLADCAVFVCFAIQDWSLCVTAHQRRRMRGWASSLRRLERRIRRLIMTTPFPFPLFSFATQFSLLFSSQSHPLYGLLSSSRRELVSGYSQTPDWDRESPGSGRGPIISDLRHSC